MNASIRSWTGLPEMGLHMAFAIALLAMSIVQTPLLAQGLDSEESIDAIVGSDVKTEEVDAEAALDRVLAALERTQASAEQVRKTFSLEELDIVYLSDMNGTSKKLEEAIAENEVEIQALQDAIEGSALFFHAVDSRSILLRDIVALEYGKEAVTIFVNGREN